MRKYLSLDILFHQYFILICRTTWDEHVIELNLARAVTLGHIDLKFSLYQQSSNPAAIQVTLLKQNTSGFGYRMKGPHSVNMGFKQSTVDESIDFSLNNNDGKIRIFICLTFIMVLIR